MRDRFEAGFFAARLPRLLEASGGGALLDLGCRDGLAGRLAGPALRRYVGVDLHPASGLERGRLVTHDLRDGLGPVGRRPFDLYLGTFGLASHLQPAELRRLLADIRGHARPGALVALEGLGRYSLEWPRLWDAPPGPARTISYRLATDVAVHPWSGGELLQLFGEAGLRPLWARDRSLQAGPKAGRRGYWPGLPELREALNAALAGAAEPAPQAALRALTSPLPPLPAGEAALMHHTLAARRRELVARGPRSGMALAEAIWRLEPTTAGGFGHGVLAVGRVV